MAPKLMDCGHAPSPTFVEEDNSTKGPQSKADQMASREQVWPTVPQEEGLIRLPNALTHRARALCYALI
ncbi:hypothetical protein JTE90_004237 [Oedothorax gibbosus]|uniref:Uncharacterized protein n=1 Tax=Oedothorax gibbosus TaxID=931172 RepID=A0AAV6UPR2_9ARAC|nr:hypothetical protein JTE90_004237 [Oedothorax gibbosus]